MSCGNLFFFSQGEKPDSAKLTGSAKTLKQPYFSYIIQDYERTRT